MTAVLAETNFDVLFRGDSLVFELTVTEDDGSRRNLQNDDLWMTAKYYKSDPDSAAVFQVSKSGGQITLQTQSGATLGKADIVVPESATSSLTKQVRLWYDVQVRSTSPARTFTVAHGWLTIKQDITRA